MESRPSNLSDDWLSLRPGVYLASGERAMHLFRRELWRSEAALGAPSPPKRAVLARLGAGPCTVADLRATCGAAEEVDAVLDRLRRDGWLQRTVRVDTTDRYTVQPLHAIRPVPPSGPDPVLSRFAVVHRGAGGFVVESPLATARLLVHDLTLLPRLADPAGTLPATLGRRFVDDLSESGLVVSAKAEEGLPLRQWRPHELWFHARTRLGAGGYDGAGSGRTLWGKREHEPPLPGRAPSYPGPVTELARPDLAERARTERPLATVMEERASVRSHDDSAPMTAAELGELLFRCGRSRRSFQRDGLEYTSRPYPSGGSLYELELYPVVGRVAGLDRGLYHYEPDEHRLRLVRGPGPHVDRLLRAATGAAQLPGPPQLLLVVSARFGRLMYSYEEIPYSLILKHVGVLYQSLYLVATAMRLAPCGLGAGDCAAFGEATGRDFVVESSVGEFLLGSRTRTDTTGELDGPAAAT